MNENSFGLSDYLVKSGMLTEAQLNLALDMQKGSTNKLGDIIVGMGMLTDIEVMKVLEKQINIPFVDLSDIVVDPAATQLIKERVAREFCLIPVGFENDKLVVIMNDPMDYITIDEIVHVTGKKILPRIGTRRQIQAAIAANYNKNINLTIDLKSEKKSSNDMIPSSTSQITEGEKRNMDKEENTTELFSEQNKNVEEKPKEPDIKPQVEGSEDYILDFTKSVRRYFTVIMLDNQSIRVRMPTKNVYAAILALRDRMLGLSSLGTDEIGNLDETYNLISIILSNNFDQRKITCEYLTNLLDIEDIKMLYEAYMKFAGLESSTSNSDRSSGATGASGRIVK
jgi:hypothetical protein